MKERAYESTLNTWLAEALRGAGLDARPESGQGGGKRIDVEVRLDGIKVALEAEQGFSTSKKASAIKDADQRLLQELADCAVAICYPDGLASSADVHGCTLLHSLRTHKDRPSAKKARWQSANIGQLARVIRRIPDQLGDPDQLAGFLSFSLNQAVDRLSESQKQSLAARLDLPKGKPTRIEFGRAQTSQFNQAAKRAMLVIATAVMFHAQLDRHRKGIAPLVDNRFPRPTPFEGDWPPPMVVECAESDDPIGEFDAAWDLWLAVDYRPIFATARNALRGCAQDSAFSAAVRSTAKAALRVVRNIVGLRHDLLGRIFHRVLETARYDGSFYTTTAAATLLATLAIREDMRDWSDSGAISRLRITDPACGTGTLLMAAAERIRDLSGGANHGRVSRHLIENVLTGYDVNLTATHLAATTLGLISPTTTFKDMKIGRALLGVENGGAFLGSLEFLDQDKQPRLLPWPTGVRQIEAEKEVAQAEPADLVIMNPPFTRDSLRHDQFSREEELALKSREKELFAEQPVHLSGNSGPFLVLANHIAKLEGGNVASVLPLVTATNASTLEIRQFLAKQFHVETIITSHDPARSYFSENTAISEMLLICRRWIDSAEKPPTKVINLYENPASPTEALGLAQDIMQNNVANIKGTVQLWNSDRMPAGNWGAVQFLSPYLCEGFQSLKAGRFFDMTELGQITEIGPAGQAVRGIFDRSEVPDQRAMVALWDHKTDITQTMSAAHDTYITAKPGKAKQAKALWQQRGTLLLAARARLNTTRLVSVRLPQRVLGSAWVPCKPFGKDVNTEKAICVYLNSTVGALAILGNRSIRDLSYSQFSMDDLRRIPVPNFEALGEAKVNALASVYDQLCKRILLPLPQIMEDETRQALDRAVVSALGISDEIVANIRRELSHEPSVTGKPYEV